MVPRREMRIEGSRFSFCLVQGLGFRVNGVRVNTFTNIFLWFINHVLTPRLGPFACFYFCTKMRIEGSRFLFSCLVQGLGFRVKGLE